MLQRDTAGLSPEEVLRSRAAHGANRYTRRRGRGFFACFFKNLGDPVIKVLLLALLLHLLLLFRNRDFAQTVGIALSVLLATLISTVSEQRSEGAFVKLFAEHSSAPCRVLRQGVRELDTSEIVVGDLVLLAAGERVPADGVLLEGRMAVDQSALTGESREVEKRPYRKGEGETPDDPGALHTGAVICSGEGVMRVCRVGDATYLGGISGELQAGAAESPLKLRLTRLSRQISRIGYVAAAVCALSYLFHALVPEAGLVPAQILARLRDLPFLASTLLHALTLALSVVVVAVPEGLPMMIAVVLSANIRRMLRDQVLVRVPAGIEAAGCMNVLFTDKTGTLTEGRLRLCAVIAAEHTYKSTRAAALQGSALYHWLSLSAHANNGAVRGISGTRERALGGNATDRALLESFLDTPAPHFSVRERLPFDSARKYAAAMLTDGCVLVSGAPDVLLPFVREGMRADGTRVPLATAQYAGVLREHAARGERVLLLCTATQMPAPRLAGSLCLLAALAFRDPVRAEAPRAVRELAGAGVRVVMVTGDSPETAAAIARECGILSGEGVLRTGAELAALSDAELTALLPRLAVVARALPADKSRLVRLSIAAGLVVGMTGDGVNDAPALRRADVGFAMGSGTQVAREAGDIVILDDNLSSIARAVLYGRTIFKSIRKFITLQLVMNFSAVGISILGPFIGVEMPVTVVQMLWINLIMDTLGGLAFAGEAPMPYYMKERPKRRDEPILTRALAWRVALLAGAGVLLSVLFLRSPHVRAFYRGEELCLLTAFFALFIFTSVVHCFNARSDRVAMLTGLVQNRAFLLITAAVAAVQVLFIYLGGSLLRTTPLTANELAFTLLCALAVLPVSWLHLFFRRLCGKESLY